MLFGIRDMVCTQHLSVRGVKTRLKSRCWPPFATRGATLECAVYWPPPKSSRGDCVALLRFCRFLMSTMAKHADSSTRAASTTMPGRVVSCIAGGVASYASYRIGVYVDCEYTCISVEIPKHMHRLAAHGPTYTPCLSARTQPLTATGHLHRPLPYHTIPYHTTRGASRLLCPHPTFNLKDKTRKSQGKLPNLKYHGGRPKRLAA